MCVCGGGGRGDGGGEQMCVSMFHVCIGEAGGMCRCQ